MSRKKVEKNISYDDVRKCYYVNLYYGVDSVTNKPISRTKTYSNIVEARKALRIHEGDMAKKTFLKPSNDTVEAFMKYWLENIAKINLAESTIYGYRNIIKNHLTPYFGQKKLQELKTKDINEYYSYMYKNSNLSRNTIRKHHDLLSNMCRHAIRENRIISNPATNSTFPQINKEEALVYSLDEMKVLLEKAKDDRLEIVITLAAYLGLRRGEICGLKWKNIDYINKVARIRETAIQVGSNIVIKKPKTSRSKRDVTLANDLIKKLKIEQHKQMENKKLYNKYRRTYYDSDLIVCWEDGRAYRPNYISELFSKFINKNEMKKITLHNLRHTFVSIAVSEGMNIVEISRMVGHSKVSTTMDIYAHLLTENNPAVTDAVADAIRVD